MPDELNHSNTTNAPTTPAASPAVPFRFSLLTLLCVTTLGGLSSAVMFSKGWDPVERLLMAFWCAGLLLGASLGRARGKPGIFSAGLGAALGCTVATFMLHSGSFAADLHGESLLAPFLVFVMCGGWSFAVGVAGFYHALQAGIVERWWQRRFFRRAVCMFAACCVLTLVGWQAWSDRPWRPAWELKVPVDARDGALEVALAPQGGRLLTYVDARHGSVQPDQAGQVHDLTPRGVTSQPFPLGWGHEAVVFTPDGLQVAARHGEQYRVFDVASGHIAYSQHMDTRWIEQQPLLPPRFSNDGKRLLVTTHTPRIQRLPPDQGRTR